MPKKHKITELTISPELIERAFDKWEKAHPGQDLIRDGNQKDVVDLIMAEILGTATTTEHSEQ